MAHEAIKPGATIGILGGGQLGRFLSMAAAKLGFKTFVYAPEDDSPAFQVATRYVKAAYEDATALTQFAAACDVITFEFENVPAHALRVVQNLALVYPPPRAAEIAQDRIAERAFVQAIGLEVAPYVEIADASDLSAAAHFLLGSGSAILKQARDGYDGKGQKRVSTEIELRTAFANFNAPCILEKLIDFEAEFSVICVRAREGSIACYDVSRNLHEEGILRSSEVPAGFDGNIERKAQAMAGEIAAALGYVGVLGVELFLVSDLREPRFIVNEIAPRVHNTGHWTMDACIVSQFENHIRTIAGWPLGSVMRHSNAVMRNLLGEDVLEWPNGLRNNPHISLYLYGKSDVRHGRKLGHVTEISPMKR